MKSVIVLGFAVMLLMAHVDLGASEDAGKLKVLVDETRVHSVPEEVKEAYIAEIEDILEELAEILRQMGIYVTIEIEIVCDEKYSFKNIMEPWGFGLAANKIKDIASVTIRDSGKLSYPVLKTYDVLVIASFEKKYSPDEVDAIRKFVENGGGLLLLADIESQNNTVSQAFDVLFYPERATIADDNAEGFADDNHMFFVDNIENHPITKDVKQIALNGGIPIVSYGSGTVLIKTSKSSWIDHEGTGIGTRDKEEKEGPFDILLAAENIGRGRAVFFGGAVSLWNEVVLQSEQENLQLFSNAVKWLGEPGGPYKQYKILNEQAQQLVSEATSLYSNHQFSEARKKFEEAVSIFEESDETYPNPDANRGIEEAKTYIEKCEIGINADNIFRQADTLFNKREYEKAIEEYEKAKPLYEEIEYTEKVQECIRKIDEANNWIALREEAASLLSQAEEALARAPSTFDPAGYESAKSLFEQSRSKWEEYNDPAQVAVCEEKIALCNDGISHIKRTKIMVIATVAVVAAGLVIAAVILIRRKKTIKESSQKKEDSV